MVTSIKGNATSTFGGDISTTGNVIGDVAVAALSTATGSAPSYSARAWVKFSSVGTLTITASGNVSSITDNGTGDYTVNFTTAMPDSHYSLAATCDADLVNGALCYMYSATAPSTTACRLATKLLNGTTTDRDRISATFTR